MLYTAKTQNTSRHAHLCQPEDTDVALSRTTRPDTPSVCLPPGRASGPALRPTRRSPDRPGLLAKRSLSEGKRGPPALPGPARPLLPRLCLWGCRGPSATEQAGAGGEGEEGEQAAHCWQGREGDRRENGSGRAARPGGPVQEGTLRCPPALHNARPFSRRSALPLGIETDFTAHLTSALVCYNHLLLSTLCRSTNGRTSRSEKPSRAFNLQSLSRLRLRGAETGTSTAPPTAIWAPSSLSELLVHLVSRFPHASCLHPREHVWPECSVRADMGPSGFCCTS